MSTNRTDREAVQELARAPGTAHVAHCAERALASGSEGDMRKALVEAATHGQTAHAVHVAKTQLGYKWNGRDYE